MENLKAKVVKYRDLLCDIIQCYKLTFLGGKQCSDLHCSTFPWVHILAFWHVYVLWLGYPLQWPCYTTFRLNFFI